MTDVVEAMARGLHAEAWPHEQWDALLPKQRDRWMRLARAAIRACHDAGGLVLREVPGERFFMDPNDEEQAYENGWNNALAKVRAAAVEGV